MVIGVLNIINIVTINGFKNIMVYDIDWDLRYGYEKRSFSSLYDEYQ